MAQLVWRALQSVGAGTRLAHLFAMNFRPRLLDTLPGYNAVAFGKDLAAGITVGIVALPLAMAIAIASGLPPASGLWAAILGGLIVGLLGGSNVQIAGPANAFIVVVYGIVLVHGVAGLMLATMMAGLLMILMGILRLGRLMRFVPDALITGFTSAIAMIILATQFKDALGLPLRDAPADVGALLQAVAQALPQLSGAALLLSAGAIAIMVAWNRAALRIPRLGRLPATLVALLGLSILAYLFKLPAETIGSRFGSAFAQFQQWPQLQWPASSFSELIAKLPSLILPALTLAVLSGIESLLCARIADDMQPQVKPHAANQELVAQGVANIVAPLLGALPITGTIARTVTNLRSGGQTPVASMVHALTLLAIMILAAPLAVHIPLAVLAGILLYLAWNMAGWKELAQLHRKPREWRVVLLVTFIVTLTFSLTWGIACGLAASWAMGKLRN
jgi:sulfate permease, SulP family